METAVNKLNSKERKKAAREAASPVVLKDLIARFRAHVGNVDWLGVVLVKDLTEMLDVYKGLKNEFLKWAIRNNKNDAGKALFNTLFMPNSVGMKFETRLEIGVEKGKLNDRLKAALSSLCEELLQKLNHCFELTQNQASGPSGRTTPVKKI